MKAMKSNYIRTENIEDLMKELRQITDKPGK